MIFVDFRAETKDTKGYAQRYLKQAIAWICISVLSLVTIASSLSSK